MNLRWEAGTELFEYQCQQANYAHELMVGEYKKVDRTQLRSFRSVVRRSSLVVSPSLIGAAGGRPASIDLCDLAYHLIRIPHSVMRTAIDSARSVWYCRQHLVS